MINRGEVRATARTVAEYLKWEYGCTEVQAMALVVKHLDLVEKAEERGSPADYPGDKIAAAEGLESTGAQAKAEAEEFFGD